MAATFIPTFSKTGSHLARAVIIGTLRTTFNGHVVCMILTERRS